MKKRFKYHKNLISQAVKNSMDRDNEKLRDLNKFAEEELKKDFLNWAAFKIKNLN